MLQTNTVTPTCLELIKELQLQAPLSSFLLVGGTALALQIGHRKSVDIDLFTNKYFDSVEMKFFLQNHFKPQYATDIITNRNGLKSIINNIKCDIVNWAVEWIDPIVVIDQIKMASLPDIFAMKLDAVANRGAKKDYIDIYVLLKRFNWNQAIEFYKRKFPYNDLQSMLKYFVLIERADDDEMPECLIPIIWDDVKVELLASYQKYIMELQILKENELIQRDDRLRRLIEKRKNQADD